MSKRRFETSSGPSQRQLRVGEVIRRALSEILTRGDHHATGLMEVSITVSEVRVSPDLRQATVFVLPLGGRDAKAALAALDQAHGELRHQVARRVKLKYAPELHFVIDDSFDRVDETRRILSDARVRRDLDD